MRTLILPCFFVFAVLSVPAFGSLLKAPVNTATVVGSTARFVCEVDYQCGVRWLFADFNNWTTPIVIYDGYSVSSQFTNRFSVSILGLTEYHLTIQNTQLVDAGLYICQEIPTNVSASAIFTVIAEKPTCSGRPLYSSDVVSGEEVRLKCIVTFSGTTWQRPQLTWYSRGQFVRKTIDVTDSTIVSSDFTIQATPPDVNYTCQTHFGSPILSSDQPANLSLAVPNYSYSCLTPVIQVQYFPMNMTVTPSSLTVFVNQSLTCNALSYPPSTYEWRELRLNSFPPQRIIARKGSSMLLTRTGGFTFVCYASNFIRGVRKQSNVTVEVTVVSDISDTLSMAPVNVAKVAGLAMAMFSCNSANGHRVQWLYQDFKQKTGPIVIYDGYRPSSEFDRRFEIDSRSNQYDLCIHYTRMADAGIYTCLVTTDYNVSASAIYTVFASRPTCGSSVRSGSGVVEGDRVELNCSVEFNGTEWQRPHLAWYNRQQRVVPSFRNNITDSVISSVITVVASQPSVNYTCKVYFESPVVADGQPTRLSQAVPMSARSQAISCSSPVIKVKCRDCSNDNVMLFVVLPLVSAVISVVVGFILRILRRRASMHGNCCRQGCLWMTRSRPSQSDSHRDALVPTDSDLTRHHAGPADQFSTDTTSEDVDVGSSFPNEWVQRTLCGTVNRFRLYEDSREYVNVASRVFDTAYQPVHIVKIERIENTIRYAQYVAEKHGMNSKRPDVTNERILWHGTSGDIVTRICDSGFDRSYCRNNVMYGKGVYFARDFSYSAQDDYSPPDDDGVKHVFQCLVLTGWYMSGSSDITVRPQGYDSVVDRTSDPSVFVIFSDTQAYPQYIVSFKV